MFSEVEVEPVLGSPDTRFHGGSAAVTTFSGEIKNSAFFFLLHSP